MNSLLHAEFKWVLLGCLLAACGGCDLLMAPAPELTRNWRGYAVPLELHDRTGKVYEAVGLRMKERALLRVPGKVGGGRLPVLVRGKELVPRSEFPSDRLIEVWGTSRRGAPGGDPQNPISRSKSECREHVIDLLPMDAPGGAIVAMAQARATAPAKDVAPAEKVDLSAPLKTVRAYATAWRDGDAATLRKVMSAKDADEQKLVDAFARFLSAATATNRAAEVKFGKDGVQKLMDAMEPAFTTRYGQLILRDLDDPDSENEVEIKGDRATADVEPVGAVFLRKDGGQWLISSPPGEPNTDQIRMFDVISQRHEQLAKDIGAGKYASPAEAAKAFMQGLFGPEP